MSCQHLWLIESPNGPTSPGVCQLCGEMREFRNSLENGNWHKSYRSGQASKEHQALANRSLRETSARETLARTQAVGNTGSWWRGETER